MSEENISTEIFSELKVKIYTNYTCLHWLEAEKWLGVKFYEYKCVRDMIEKISDNFFPKMVKNLNGFLNLSAISQKLLIAEICFISF